MNERIRELILKAGGKNNYSFSEPQPWKFSVSEVEKFAELIVKECVYEIKMTMVRDGYDTKHYLQSRKHIEHICKHFGVEGDEE